ncbi:MAG: Tetratricopeptide repeat protein, partial [Cyanobacteriota bacterium erpe_2018_sw_21hr_WHONDRS-SW48-000092_B_bin.40]|nr:Tetratricopeptide repeat protein [Cyanobacteriota bacterium erpe_2018_sw_21hr_WHONDRS-SW48-000092_B_bin.40]
MTEKARSRIRQNLQAVATASLLLTTWLASASQVAHGKGLVKSYAIENQAYTLSAQAEELSRQGNYPSALALLKQAASYDPTSYSERIHLDMADCYQKLKNLDQAIVETKAAANFNPERSNALYMLALIYYQAERFDLCITALNSYLKVADPAGRAQAQELLVRVKSYDCAKLGTAKLGSGQVKEAIKYLELASSADPSANSSCVHANLSYAYRQSGQLDKAIAEGKKALQYDAKDSSVTYNLAISYQDQANFVEAISWLRRYLELESDGNRRTQAEQLISELQDDLKKLKSANNSRPDYLEILKEKDHLWTWSSKNLPLKVFISSAKGVAGYRS